MFHAKFQLNISKNVETGQKCLPICQGIHPLLQHTVRYVKASLCCHPDMSSSFLWCIVLGADGQKSFSTERWYASQDKTEKSNSWARVFSFLKAIFCFYIYTLWMPHCLKITQIVAFQFFQFWHFPPIFVLLKVTCLVTLFDRKLQVVKNWSKWINFGIFVIFSKYELS